MRRVKGGDLPRPGSRWDMHHHQHHIHGPSSCEEPKLAEQMEVWKCRALGKGCYAGPTGIEDEDEDEDDFELMMFILS